jgi:hypothetical protein
MRTDQPAPPEHCRRGRVRERPDHAMLTAAGERVPHPRLSSEQFGGGVRERRARLSGVGVRFLARRSRRSAVDETASARSDASRIVDTIIVFFPSRSLHHDLARLVHDHDGPSGLVCAAVPFGPRRRSVSIRVVVVVIVDPVNITDPPAAATAASVVGTCTTLVGSAEAEAAPIELWSRW